MKRIDLYINNQAVDFGPQVKIQLDKIVSEYRDPTKATGAYSLAITLPYTQKNKEIFFNENDKQVLGKFRRSYPAQLLVDDQQVISGSFLHLRNSSKGFEGAIGEARLGEVKLGNLILKKKLTDIKSFIPLDFRGSETISESWANTLAYPDAEVCFPWVMPSFAQLKTGFRSTYEDLGVSHFVGAIVKNIFTDAGYQLQGDILENSTYQKLVMLYSSQEKQRWNWGKLALMRSECDPTIFSFGGSFMGSDVKRVDRQSDYVYIIRYPFKATVGDLCASQGNDGVYTCKFTGVYGFQVQGNHSVQGLGGQSVTSTGFTAFRCITDDEFIPDALLPPVSGFSAVEARYLDSGTLAVGPGGVMNITVRLEEGKQYELQRYVSVPRSLVDSFRISFINPDAGKFHILSVDAPKTVNPASFLPTMSQADFLQGIFKIFNLYYQINEEQKIVTLLTRDDFFQETLQDVVNLSPYLHLETMEESPLTDKEIGQTYLSYAEDDSDFILKQTNYLELVNGDQPEESTKLPFAPLGFVRRKFTVSNETQTATVEGWDLIPAIIPANESEDTSVLDDEDAFSQAGSWTPRLLLYHGPGWLRDDKASIIAGLSQGLPLVGLGKFSPGSPDYIGGFIPGSYEYQGYAPKLGFFDIGSQPAYTIVENEALRSFELQTSIGDTIYDQGGNPDFLADITRLDELNLVSLAPNIDTDVNPKGFFFQLYSNDILIGNLSNYLEGQGRMNPVLFEQLTGRQVLQLDQDLFLLESIRGYDVSQETATYKIFKLVTNTGSELASQVRFTSTQSFTATCGTGYLPGSLTREATRTSYKSQEQADTLALAEAKRLAELELVCKFDFGTNGSVPTWTATQTATAYCPNNYSGNPVTVTRTYTSTLGYLDAVIQALALAQLQAESELQCEYSPDNPGPLS